MLQDKPIHTMFLKILIYTGFREKAERFLAGKKGGPQGRSRDRFHY